MKLAQAELKEDRDIYEARIWRKWANMDDVIHHFDNETEAFDDILSLRDDACDGDTLTVKHCKGWDTDTLYRGKK